MLESIETLVGQFERKEISRRQLIGGLLAAATMTGSSARPVAAAEAPVLPGSQINHITIGVSDLKRSRAFYERMFGVTVWHDGTTDAKKGEGFYDMGLRGKQSFISISERLTPGVINHCCIGVENLDTDRAVAELKKTFPEQAPNPQKLSRIDGKPLAWPSFNVKDPDGLSIQIGHQKYQLDGRR